MPKRGNSSRTTPLRKPSAVLTSQYPVEPAAEKAGWGVLPKATIHHERKSNGAMPARNAPMTRPRWKPW